MPVEPPRRPNIQERETTQPRHSSSESSSHLHAHPRYSRDSLSRQLAQCGLSHYRQIFEAAGFTTWDLLLGIQERDLEKLGVKRGHRRKLQRHIGNYKHIQEIEDLQEVPTDTEGSIHAITGANPADSTSSSLETSVNPFVARLAIGELPESSNYGIYPSNRGPLESTPVIASGSWDFKNSDPADSSLHKGKARLEPHTTSKLDSPSHVRYNDWSHMRETQDSNLSHQVIGEPRGHQDLQRGSSSGSSSSVESVLGPQSTLRGRSPPGYRNARHRAVTDSERRHFRTLLRQTRLVLEGLTGDAQSGGLRLDESMIPPRATLTKDVNAFFEATISIFFTFTSDDTDTLLDHVFNTEGSSIDPIAVAELTVIAAVGRSYGQNPKNAKTFRRQCYRSCLRFLEDDINVSHLRYMRFFLCLSISCAMDDFQNSRDVLRTAQYIGRTHPLLTPSNSPSEHSKGSYWCQIFGSVVLFHHLFYSLDDEMVLTNRDVEIASCRLQVSTHSFQQDIQSETSKVAILITNLLRQTNTSEHLDMHSIHACYQKIIAWRDDLPPALRFPARDSPGFRTLKQNERCFVLIMHMFVHSMTASAFRSSLFSTAPTAETRNSSPSEAHRNEMVNYRDDCIRETQQSGQIASFLASDSEESTTLWAMR